MSTVTLADLVAPASVDDVLALELSIATTLGLPTTAWQPLSIVRTLMAIQANLIAQQSGVVNLIAQGAYASSAAQMVDSSGNPITTWMDLRGVDQYNAPRVPVVYASGPVPVNNTLSGNLNYTVGQLHFQNPTTGATYTNTQSGLILPFSSGIINVQADAAFGGSIGTSGAGITLILMTPVVGAVVTPLTQSLVGQDAESNAAYFTRCIAKLGSLSALWQLGTPAPPNPAGAAGAYDFVARSIPQASVASAVWPYRVVTPITRTAVDSTAGSGVVVMYIANAAGAPSSADLAAVTAAIYNLVVPQAVTAAISAATNAPIDVAATVYVRNSGTTNVATVTARIASALAQYFATVPIGGVDTSTVHIVPLSEIENAIFNANAGTIDVDMVSPLADVSVSASGVPVLNGAPAIAVVLQ